MMKISRAGLFELAKSLVDIPSVTGNEAAMADFLCTLLAEERFDVRPQDVEAGRRNILAVAGGTPAVVLCTHMDTVPEWIAAGEDAVHISGRGACDAKGIMAAMIVAAAELRDEGLEDIGLLFLVGEETDSAGAKKANLMSPGSKFIIVGEPTGNKLATAHKGVLTLTLTARGKTAHSAYPERGESAILKLLDVLADIRDLDFGRDPVLGPTVMNVGRISGGTASNVIPGSAEAVLSFRTGVSPDLVLSGVRSVTAGRADVVIHSKSQPQVLFTPAGFSTELMPYGTDIPYLTTFGRPLLLGPGSVLDAHIENERVEKKQLEEAVDLYKRLVRRLMEE
ncbi:MAG TPA: M20/M25/M40 family metallo-hydrolase [Candidatus Latescibacteria bacterium]|nr:M20/M25/M40 family metallo-hydrolase [Candidatus Latescibacterota bacterium]